MKIYNVEKLSIVQERKQEEKQREQNIEKVPNLETDVQEVAELTAYALLDTSAVAELTALLLEDSTATGEVLAMALEKIVELETRIEQLEGGN